MKLLVPALTFCCNQPENQTNVRNNCLQSLNTGSIRFLIPEKREAARYLWVPQLSAWRDFLLHSERRGNPSRGQLTPHWGHRDWGEVPGICEAESWRRGRELHRESAPEINIREGRSCSVQCRVFSDMLASASSVSVADPQLWQSNVSKHYQKSPGDKCALVENRWWRTNTQVLCTDEEGWRWLSQGGG